MQEQSSSSGTGAALILVAAVLWGTTGTAQEYAPDGTPSSTLGLLRVAIAGVALLGVAAARRELPGARGLPVAATAIAAAAMGAYQPLFFTGVARTGVAVGTIVAIGSAPVLAGALAFALRGERVERRWFAATALAVAGAALLALGGSDLGVDAGGVLLSLGAGAAYAVFAVVVKGLLERHPPVLVMATVFTGAAVVLSPVLLVADVGWVASTPGALVAVYLGVLVTAAAYLFFAGGLRRTPVATATTITLAEPLTAALLGLALLDETFTAGSVAGMLLLLGGLVLLTVRRPVAARYSA